LDKVARVRLQSVERLARAAGPFNVGGADFYGRAQAEVQPLRRLGEIAVTGAQLTGVGVAVGANDDARSDRVAVAVDTLQAQADVVVLGRGFVEHDAQLRAGAIAQPQVEIAVEVPIAGGHRAPIVHEIQPESGGHIRKRLAFQIEINAIPLAPAPGGAGIHQAGEGRPSRQVALGGWCGQRGLGGQSG
jgi:hypothetical protein